MPLNYSKWDALELSDDSDIEGHPNVDHKSLVRWKQRDIHEKRAVRNARITELQAEIDCNDVLLPRLRTITEEVHGATDGPAKFSSIVEQLRTNPSPDAPRTNAQKSLTYDEMILALLMQVYNDAKQKGVDKNDERLREVLIANLKSHVVKLGERQETLKKELDAELSEKAKKITTDDIHEGFESKYVPPKPEPPPIASHKPKKVTKTQAIEVLNPKAVEEAAVAQVASKSSPAGQSASSKTDDDDDDVSTEDNEIPEMTPILTEFSKLPLRAYEASFEFIKQHREVYVEGASDALLVAAFTAETKGQYKYAKQCVHQSLLLQYCEKLGKDGPGLFFRRMMSGDPRAETVFLKDVEDTYEHIKKRVQVVKEEESANAEQIQLVPENPNQKISFIVPDGPPPEDLRLEGPGTENLDIQQVREALQMRWEVFESFSQDLQNALRQQSLEAVNKVLGNMNVEEAERVVGLLDNAGILNFAEGGVRDETGKVESE